MCDSPSHTTHIHNTCTHTCTDSMATSFSSSSSGPQLDSGRQLDPAAADGVVHDGFEIEDATDDFTLSSRLWVEAVAMGLVLVAA